MLKGPFRGTMVCEKAPVATDILRAPFDLRMDGKSVAYARPLFNWNGTRVVGSELGNGAIESDGTVRLTSAWSTAGIDYRTEYSGSLTPKGGTLMGTQSWHGRGATGSRTCVVAVVPAPRG
jgi:hypothetical protein